MAEQGGANSPRRWVVLISGLTGGALTLFLIFYAVDHYLYSGPDQPASPIHRFLAFEEDHLSDAVSSLAAMIAAVFGIVVTVVSIIVQLSANRFTGVTRMFLRDTVNLLVPAYYIVVCGMGVWLSVSLQKNFVPEIALLAMMVLTTVGLAMMAPYFNYVFWFLEPMNIVARIEENAVRRARTGAEEPVPALSFKKQADVLAAMEELTDITSNSIAGRDKIIASGAVDALKDFALEYVTTKSRATDAWFTIGPGIRSNPDFVAMDPESLGELEQRRTWVEWKVMRQFMGIYTEALASMRDINYLIAIDTRYIGEAAGRLRDQELIKLVYRFMNSYMRATLNARDVRTAYNVMNQYRLLVESMIRSGATTAALEGLQHMKYYGHVSFDMNLPFVTETVAYDVSTLVEVANAAELEEEAHMLQEFLELDRPLLARSQEKGLLGVRKAQVKLACYYLSIGLESKARTIADDMCEEPKDRLLTIRRQLEAVTSKDFWEITERGRTFEFMQPKQRACIATFFSWLDLEEAAPVSKTTAAS